MDAREYFETAVMPIWTRLQNEPEALELEIAATTMIFHTADYMSKTSGQKLEDVRQRIRELIPEFAEVHGAAIANKHQKVGHSPAKHKELTRPQQNMPNVLTFNGDRLVFDGQSLSFGITPCYVFQDGSELPILPTLEKIIDVLDQETANP